MKYLAPFACLILLAAKAVAAESLPSFPGGKFTITRPADAVVLKNTAGIEVLRYQLVRPADSKLAVDSGCYFHPFATPSGVAVTEVAPADHLHHRGVFLAWVEMHGKKDADFWGWGEHAPKDNRKIVNREILKINPYGAAASFAARNEWLAEGEPLVKEYLAVSLRSTQEANVLELTYTLTADADVTLTRWAFSGFCVRTRKDGELTTTGPEGPVNTPNPSHLKPESDWPDAAWYDFSFKLPDGKTAGVAVLNDPQNPPSLWHNHRDIRMINPCIVAPQAVVLKGGQPLVLRYRVVAHDGPAPKEFLDRVAKSWVAR